MFNSLRSRLWLTYVLVIGVVLGIVALAVVLYLANNPLSTNLRLWAAAGAVLSQPLGGPMTLARLEEIAQRVDEGYDLRVVVIDQDGDTLIDTREDSEAAIPALDVGPNRREPLPIQEFEDEVGQRWLYSGRQIQGGVTVLLLTPRPRFGLLAILQDDLFVALLRAGFLAFLLSLAMAYWISRWVAAPLQNMSEATKVLAEGELRPIRPEGPNEVKALAHSINEMSHQVHASQQSQRDFVANVSHELKTPLTSIQGFAQAILDGTAETREAQDRAAQVIYDEAGRMHRLVVDFLDLARLDAGTADLQRQPLDLSSLLRNAVEKMRPQSQSEQVELGTEIGELPAFIGDGDRLVQVFTNLIDNALKHTPAGGRVMVGAQAKGDQVSISFQDYGPGIPQEELARIFERFYQLDKSRARGDGSGVGLGLAIAKQIVQAHHGRLYAHSQVGKGSSFIVQLPVARPEDETAVTKRSTFFEGRR